jgi:sugar phosphate isomerase/epimerase
VNRAAAYRWLDVAARLGARQVRIDAGGPETMPDEVFEIIVSGYNDVINRASDLGLMVLIENHWGPSIIPENVIKLLTEVDGLGLLFDSGNWADGRQADGWTMCASYASAVHIQTFEFDAEGNDPTVDIARVVRLLAASGYEGVWGIESIPHDGDEYGAVKKTAALIARTLDER